jgi:uncharacterized membrane protein
MQNIEFKTGVIRPIECFREGWELIKPHYWIMFAITLVGMLIGSAVPFMIVMGAMHCGVYYVLFRLSEGKPPEFSDLFKGFNYFLPALIATLILIVPVIVFSLISWFSMMGVMFSMMDKGGRPDPSMIFTLYGVMIVEGLVFGVISSCIHAFIIFAYPLIVEHGLSGIEAFKLSARAAWANIGSVVGLILCQVGIGLVGALACGFGLYFTFPIMFAGVFVAYRKVFPPFNAPNLGPPPPTAYEGLS